MTALSPLPPPVGRLPRRIALSYSAGAIGTGVFSTVPRLLLLYYLPDVVGVAAGIGLLFTPGPALQDRPGAAEE